jgi:DNA-binding Lrp family transcriptional regulator
MAGSSVNADIETGADTLLSFLEEKTKWPVSKIADDLGVPEETVKKWARALEKEGYVNIKYSAIKGMVLEYASDKTYEELNEGRSELSLEADEIEIEAETIEGVSSSSGGETETVVDEDMDMEPVGTDGGKNSDTGSRPQTESKDVEDMDMEPVGESSNSKKGEALGTGEGEGESIEEGKEKLRKELEDKKPSEDSGKSKAKVKAKKAKFKQASDDHRNLTEIQNKVSSRSDGTADEKETGNDLNQILGNISDESDMLLEDDNDKGEVYSQLEAEMRALKDELMERSVDDNMKKQIFDTLDKVERDIEKSESTGFFGKVKKFFSGLLGGS